MPTVLREHQHELCDLDDNSVIVFGTEDTGYLTLSPPVTEGAEQTNGDRNRPQEDGRMFGRDYRGAKSVVFEIGVLTDHLSADAHRANLDYLDTLEGIWTDERWRDDPSAMVVLRSHEAGQTWRCYGRPRRYEEVVSKMTMLGYTPVVADFPLIDNSWYSDEEHAIDVTLGAGSLGGLKAPVKAPASTTQATSGSASMVVGGSRPTWPVVEFHGPITNPEVTIGSLVIGLDRILGAGEVLIFDPRPWQRTVYRESDGAGFAGQVSMRTPLMKRATIRPGEYTATLAGKDPTGTARVRVRWRDARSRT